MSELSHEINIVNKLFEYKCQECFALVQKIQIKTLKISPDVNKAVLLNKSLEVDSRLQVNLQLILRQSCFYSVNDNNNDRNTSFFFFFLAPV